jgi:5-methylthioribose kinase
MIRRILGFAHVIDFDCIQDAALRGNCEASALAMAHRLLTHPEQFHSVVDVIDAVPRMIRDVGAGQTRPVERGSRIKSG